MFTHKIKNMIIPDKKFWEVFKETPGALSSAEALAIMSVAALSPSGMWLEMGTHKGKSAMAAACGARFPTTFCLLEPEFKDKNWESATYYAIEKALIVCEKDYVGVYPFPDYSTDFLVRTDVLNTFYAYVFVDTGSHGDGLPMREAKLLEDKIVPHGIICFHDYRNQFVEVEQAFEYLISTGKYEKIDIEWNEIFDYVKENNLEDGNNSWHLYPELPHPPNFVGALKRK
jgi:hypothetical protein